MIATYMPGSGAARTDGRMCDAIPFLAICPKCKRQRPQDWYTRGELLGLLNAYHPVEAHCETCDHFWTINAQERSRLVMALGERVVGSY
jgi:hypothetical protein